MKFLPASADLDHHNLPKATGMWPSFQNLALKAVISENATCGQHGKEEYCRLTDTSKGRSAQCDICDENNPDLEKRHPITYAIDGTNKWWQSPSLHKGSKYERVTINLDLGQVRLILRYISNLNLRESFLSRNY